MSHQRRDLIFVSYSHVDAAWLDRLQVHLAPLLGAGLNVRAWSDTEIKPGDLWDESIGGALDRACAAVLLISPDFLASTYIMSAEIPRLVAAVSEGVKILWIPVRPSSIEATELGKYQALCDPRHPLESLPNNAAQDHCLVQIARAICDHARPCAAPPAGAAVAAPPKACRKVPIWAQSAIIVLALVLLFAAAARLRPLGHAQLPAPSSPTPNALPHPSTLPSSLPLRTQVLHADGWVPLELAGPLLNGQKIRIECGVPPGQYASLLLLDSQGALQELAHLEGPSTDRLLHYPGPGHAVPLTEPSGTELIIVAARRDHAVDIAFLKVQLPWNDGCPTLKPGDLLRLADGRVESLGDDRGLGTPVAVDPPTAQTRLRMEELHRRLAATGHEVSAVAFSHEAGK